MEPATVGLLALGALLIANQKEQGAYGAGSTRVKLTPGNYRARFTMAPISTALPMTTLLGIPQATLGGLGMLCYFESVTTNPFNAQDNWTMTAVCQYGGAEKVVDLLPGMSLEKL